MKMLGNMLRSQIASQLLLHMSALFLFQNQGNGVNVRGIRAVHYSSWCLAIFSIIFRKLGSLIVKAIFLINSAVPGDNKSGFCVLYGYGMGVYAGGLTL